MENTTAARHLVEVKNTFAIVLQTLALTKNNYELDEHFDRTAQHKVPDPAGTDAWCIHAGNGGSCV